jgi:uncharacterized protein (UPF0276 family)
LESFSENLMIQLTAKVSDGLVELIQSGAVEMDGVEANPWFEIEQVRAYRRQLPGWRFTFHHGDLVSQLKWVPGTGKRLREYIESTRTPWLSFHCSLLPPGYVRVGTKLGWYPPSPDPDRAVKSFVAGVERLRGLNLPILLENMPSFPTTKYAFETSTETISEILALTGADLLLDIAHARVVASVFDRDVHDYLGGLPLEKVRQIHVSGPRAKGGTLYDAHEVLEEEDYRLLAWVLARCEPEVVTLEYFEGKQELREQLVRLKDLIASVQ